MQHGMKTSINGRVPCACAWSGPGRPDNASGAQRPTLQPFRRFLFVLDPGPSALAAPCRNLEPRGATTTTATGLSIGSHSLRRRPAGIPLEDPISIGPLVTGSVRLQRAAPVRKTCERMSSSDVRRSRGCVKRLWTLGSTSAQNRSRCTIGIVACRTYCGQLSTPVRPEIAALGVPQPQAEPDLNIHAT